MTVVVADTGDFESIKKYTPRDVTTNPSLIYAASQLPQYQAVVDAAVKYAKEHGKTKEEQCTIAIDRLAVGFGNETLKLVQGRVSTEIDARLSYDTEGTIAKCRQLMKYYEEFGVDWRTRVLFKIASTWEGIKAAEQLEKEGIHCNLTLLFAFPQAVACAEAGVTLISPFVGRILDFWKKETGKASYPPTEDPGVLSVSQIYNYYKKYGYKTIVMGASFRNVDEIMELAGCDYLTISPKLLDDLLSTDRKVERKLTPEKAQEVNAPKVTFDEKAFRFAMCNDPCGTSKLPEGIRNFSSDIGKLESYIKTKL
jgi:transaldolase